MAPKTIVSYDDTLNDHDALMLGRVLADAGAELDARVRPPHDAGRARSARSSRSTRPRRCSSAAPAGSATSTCARRVVVSASTGEGLEVARRAGAGRRSSCSAPTTAPPPATSRPQRSAQRLLEGGPAARRDRARPTTAADRDIQVRWIGVLENGSDQAARQTATELAEHLGASVTTEHPRHRPAGRRLAHGGSGRPRDDHGAGRVRDRERDLPGAGRRRRRADPLRLAIAVY